MTRDGWAGRTAAVARKEVLHILRDPTTLFFALFIPIVELVLLGYAIDTNVRHVRTAVLDQAKTQESRSLLRAFETTDDFDVVARAEDEPSLTRMLVSGRARIGIRIPEDYSRRLLARSPNFFIPGLMVVLVQLMSVMLTASTIVREKENGTLEQLYMTPVRSGEIVLGKVAPYTVMAFAELGGIAFLMRFLFAVPIRGSFGTLLLMVLPFILAMQGLGLLISVRAQSRDAAMQMAMGTVIPSIFLSGYVFPLDSMPVPFQWVGRAIPTTWLIECSRGVILRGAGWAELWPNAAVLGGMAAAVLALTAFRFPRRVV